MMDHSISGNEAALMQRLESARKAFEAGHFQKAQKIKRQIESDVRGLLRVKHHGPAPDPQVPVKASIVILSYRDSDVVSSALNSLAAQLRKDCEVILVSNGNHRLLERGKRALGTFKFIDMPVNVGCGMGRNLAAGHAIGEYVIFLEDDGIAEPGCIDALLTCAEETGAVMVRGRYVSLSGDPKNDPRHYDLGRYRRLAFLNCGGVSCVRRKEFIEHEGFDPVMVGYEGPELCARMWRFFGPLGFWYEPAAIVRHDYTAPGQTFEQKVAGQDKYRRYAEAVSPHAFQVMDRLEKARVLTESAVALASLAEMSADLGPEGGGPLVSVITTAKNGAIWLDDYLRCWTNQTYQNYEIVFVDDGSTDDTLSRIRKAAATDDRIHPIAGDGGGRSAALNTAIAAAKGEILAIADVDDVSRPDRLELTVRFLTSRPDVDVLSFTVFNDKHLNWIGGRPLDPRFADLKVRGLLGMQGRFPTYAFRRNFAKVPFDTGLAAGVDFDWASRNFAANLDARGYVLPVPVTYYRKHDRSMTSHFSDIQKQVRLDTIRYNFGRLIGELSDEDEIFISAIATQSANVSGFHAGRYRMWVNSLIGLNCQKRIFDPAALEVALSAERTPLNMAVAGLGSMAEVVSAAKQARLAGDHIASRQILKQLRNDTKEIMIEIVIAEKMYLLRRLVRGAKRWVAPFLRR